MRFNEYMHQGFRMLFFNKKAVKQAIADKDAARNGFSMLLLFSVLVGLLGGALFYIALYLTSKLNDSAPIAPTFGVFVYATVFVFVVALLAQLVSVGITHLLAKLFGGKRKVLPYFAAWMSLGFALLCCSVIVMFLAIIPYLGTVIQIAFIVYSLFLTVFVVRESYSISNAKATATVLIPVVLVLIAFVLVYVYLAPVTPA